MKGVVVAALFATACPGPKSVSLSLIILDKQTEQPVPMAHVRVAPDRALRQVEPETGRFVIHDVETPKGLTMPLQRGETVIVEVTAAGYRPLQISHTATADAAPVILKLEPMDATQSGSVSRDNFDW